MDVKAKIIDEDGLSRIITRMAHEILEKNKGSQNLVLMGMKTRGEFLARRIFERIKEIERIELPLRADYIGKNIPTSNQEEIKVKMKEIDGEDAIYLMENSVKN